MTTTHQPDNLDPMSIARAYLLVADDLEQINTDIDDEDCHAENVHFIELCRGLAELCADGRQVDAFGAAALGRRGGKKGGLARAASMTSERRSEVARLAANARWHRAPTAG